MNDIADMKLRQLFCLFLHALTDRLCAKLEASPNFMQTCCSLFDRFSLDVVFASNISTSLKKDYLTFSSDSSDSDGVAQGSLQTSLYAAEPIFLNNSVAYLKEFALTPCSMQGAGGLFGGLFGNMGRAPPDPLQR